MKNIYTLLVYEEQTNLVEKLLNTFHVGLNEWDRSKTFENRGYRMVNYTILCGENIFAYISSQLNM